MCVSLHPVPQDTHPLHREVQSSSALVFAAIAVRVRALVPSVSSVQCLCKRCPLVASKTLAEWILTMIMPVQALRMQLQLLQLLIADQ